ncbi:MAG: LysM peptidoglycan-binding domain-containing protein [Akkermansiaceae bacterium]|nr:LysM peptidoglycan-binding domain-containing protein [Akkermansiaceae bacterium]
MIEELEEIAKGGTSPNIRRKQREGGMLRIITGIVVAVLLGALVFVANGLHQTRLELAEMRDLLQDMEGKSAAPPAQVVQPSIPPAEFAELKESVETIQSTVSNSLDQTTKEILATGRDAASDRKTLKLNLARILFQQGVPRDEIFPLTVGLSHEERNQFLDQLEMAKRGANGESVSPGTGAGDVAIVAPPVVVPPVVTTEEDPLPLPRKETPSEPAASPGKESSEEVKLPEPAPAAENSTIYVVKSGDTISAIARRFGVSTQTLLSVNKIRNANRIAVGMKLKIPGK